jgi:hypothetical protein
LHSKEVKLKDAPTQNKKELMEYTFDGQIGITFQSSMQAMQEDTVWSVNSRFPVNRQNDW